MKAEWIKHAQSLALTPAEFYSGARKILRHQTLTFDKFFTDPLAITDAGYTSSKLTMLRKHYLHEESRAVALELWQKRKAQETYGSVSFTTFNHFVKGGSVDAPRSKRASVFGPCIQSVMITQIKGPRCAVDVAYRTTEFFKKFPADLVFLRDELLQPFDLPSDTPVTFYFANVTMHPMYYVTLIPHQGNPVAQLDRLKKIDPHFYKWAVKWTARYLCEEHSRGILKFSQALRVRSSALKSISKSVIKELQRYLRANHPGFTRDYADDEDNDP